MIHTLNTIIIDNNNIRFSFLDMTLSIVIVIVIINNNNKLTNQSNFIIWSSSVVVVVIWIIFVVHLLLDSLYLISLRIDFVSTIQKISTKKKKEDDDDDDYKWQQSYISSFIVFASPYLQDTMDIIIMTHTHTLRCEWICQIHFLFFFWLLFLATLLLLLLLWSCLSMMSMFSFFAFKNFFFLYDSCFKENSSIK